MNSENAADQPAPSSAMNRRKQTLEHLSARHQQLKQQKQQFKTDEITKLDEVESLKKTDAEPDTSELPDTSCFLVDFKGAVLGANFQGIDHIYCRYSYVYGPDWKIINGENESGYSQMASRNGFTKRIYLNTFDSCGSRSQSGDGLDFVWNLPIELTMSSSNVSGWPQLAVSVYGLNFFGLDVVRGQVC